MSLKKSFHSLIFVFLFAFSVANLQASSVGKLPDSFEYIVEGIYPQQGGQVLILKGYDHQHYRVLFPNSVLSEVSPLIVLDGESYVKKKMLKVLAAPAKLMYAKKYFENFVSLF